MPRKPGTGNAKPKPVLQFEPPVKKKKVSVEIATDVAELLDKYPGFVKATSGATPAVDEVLEKALVNVFKRDKAFQAYLTQQNSGNRQPDTRSTDSGK